MADGNLARSETREAKARRIDPETATHFSVLLL